MRQVPIRTPPKPIATTSPREMHESHFAGGRGRGGGKRGGPWVGNPGGAMVTLEAEPLAVSGGWNPAGPLVSDIVPVFSGSR